MARPNKRYHKTYIDKDGVERERQKCSVPGCTRMQQLAPLKKYEGQPQRFVGLFSCGIHRKDGRTFDCITPEKRRERGWKAQGIKLSHEQYEAMLEAQDFRCALCGRTEEEVGDCRHFGVDHDHATGRVRGILCRRCNAMLGWIEKDIPLDKLDDYLKGVVK